MIWRRVTACLVCACFALTGWIYLRDRGTSGLPVSERQQAQYDAERALSVIVSPRACQNHCTASVQASKRAHVWLVRLSAPAWKDCFELKVDAFGFTPGRGLTGLRSTACD